MRFPLSFALCVFVLAGCALRREHVDPVTAQPSNLASIAERPSSERPDGDAQLLYTYQSRHQYYEWYIDGRRLSSIAKWDPSKEEAPLAPGEGCSTCVGVGEKAQ